MTRRGSSCLTIKRQTAAVHREAEAAVARAAPFADRASYARYLTALHGFYAHLEPALCRQTLPGIDLEARRKLALIAADLRALGAKVPAADVTLAPLPRIHHPAAAFGVAYVLEGKTLGSRFLLEEARRTLGVDVLSGARFFAGYGERTGAMWNEFRGALEDYVATEGRRTTVLRASRATFAAFIGWVDAFNAARA